MKELIDELGTCMIGEHSVFSFLCGENIDELARFFKQKTVKSGETIWTEGDPSDYVAIISSGRIEVKKKTEFGGKYIVVGIYSKGSVVGPLGVLDGHPRAATAVALEDVTLVTITKADLEKLIDENPVLGNKLLKGMLISVSIRLRKSFERLVKFF